MEERPRAYFDTSVIAKRYIPEQGEAQAHHLLRHYGVIASQLVSIELASAFRRRLDDRVISYLDYQHAIHGVMKDRCHWDLIPAGAKVLSRAEKLLAAYPVRAFDAIHIASALYVRETVGLGLPFVTGDQRQREGAMFAGLEVIWVA
jgi:predicted nucleic acid-binding protein